MFRKSKVLSNLINTLLSIIIIISGLMLFIAASSSKHENNGRKHYRANHDITCEVVDDEDERVNVVQVPLMDNKYDVFFAGIDIIGYLSILISLSFIWCTINKENWKSILSQKYLYAKGFWYQNIMLGQSMYSL